MVDFSEQYHDTEMVSEADKDDYYAGWTPNFCVRPKSDDVEDPNSALVSYQVEQTNYEERVGALEDECNAMKAAYDLLFEFTQFVLHDTVRKHPNIVMIANLFGSFRNPHPDSITGWKTKYEEANLRGLLAQIAAAEDSLFEVKQQEDGAKARVRALEAKIDKLESYLDNMNVQIQNLHSTCNTLQPGSTQHNIVNNNNYYQGGPSQDQTIPSAPPQGLASSGLLQGHTLSVDRSQDQERPHSLGERVPKLPRYRQSCKKGKACTKSGCHFTHPRQRAFFGAMSINNLKDFVTLENCGRPENGGV